MTNPSTVRKSLFTSTPSAMPIVKGAALKTLTPDGLKGSKTYGSTTYYIHPSGEFNASITTTSAFMCLEAFGGAVVSYKRFGLADNKLPDALVFESVNGEIMATTMNKDDVARKHKIYPFEADEKTGGLYMISNPVLAACGGTVHGNGKMNARAAYDFYAALPLEPAKPKAKPPIVRNHPELYEAQERVLQELQNQPDGFHMLSGEVGVGKTHIAADYINDSIKANPKAKVLVIEPIEGVVERFTSLIEPEYLSNVTITDDTKKLKSGEWDVVVFDEFHKMDKDKAVARYALDVDKMPKNILAMTGTVSNTYPEQVWSVSKNYIARYVADNGIDAFKAGYLGPYNNQGIPQMTSIRNQPEFFVEHVLGDSTAQIVRADIEELDVEAKMPVNKYSAGFDLTPTDKAFYALLKGRANSLGMDKADQLTILDAAFNTNQKEFVIQQSNIYKGGGMSSPSFQLVNPDDVPRGSHDLLYLGRHDQPFQDKKIDFITNLSNDVDEKVLVYLSSNDYAERVVDDLRAQGKTAQFVDTHVSGAVKAINDSDADVIVFDVNPIREGVELKANHVVWYSTPNSAGLDEQACGRITRLSSEPTDKNFYYLYHKTTVQEEVTKRIIQTNNINNIALNREVSMVEDIQLDIDDKSFEPSPAMGK